MWICPLAIITIMWSSSSGGYWLHPWKVHWSPSRRSESIGKWKRLLFSTFTFTKHRLLLLLLLFDLIMIGLIAKDWTVWRWDTSFLNLKFSSCIGNVLILPFGHDFIISIIVAWCTHFLWLLTTMHAKQVFRLGAVNYNLLITVFTFL